MSMLDHLLPRQAAASPISGPLPILTTPASKPEPWATKTGHLEGREWYRLNPDAPRDEFYKWAVGTYIPQFLRGMGWNGERERVTYAPDEDAPTADVRVLSPDLEEMLDDLAVGLAKAHEMHERGRAHHLD